MSRVSPRAVRRLLPSLAVAALLGSAVAASAQVVAGHRLPEGPERPVRERTIDVRRLRVDLRLDLDAETVAGHVDVDFTPLRTDLREVRLDAADLRVSRVALTARGKAEADVPYGSSSPISPMRSSPGPTPPCTSSTRPGRAAGSTSFPRPTARGPRSGTTAREGSTTPGCPSTTTPTTASPWRCS
jgi:aminopeptidase N